MKLLSVNVSLPKEVPQNGKPVRTGIFKEAVGGRVMLRKRNLDGDAQADLRAHGGRYKAAYAYPYEHYAYWLEALNREDFSFGQFGENFTVQGMTEEKVHVGDVYRIGGALVRVTQPRVPCFKLGLKMGDPRFVKQFMNEKRTGFYLSVIEEGEVGAGDPIELVQADPTGMSVRDIFHLLYFDPENSQEAQRALQIKGMSPGWRRSFKEMTLSIKS